MFEHGSLIPNTEHIVAQQLLLALDLVDECARKIARVDDALWFSGVIENRRTSHRPGIQARNVEEDGGVLLRLVGHGT